MLRQLKKDCAETTAASRAPENISTQLGANLTTVQLETARLQTAVASLKQELLTLQGTISEQQYINDPAQKEKVRLAQPKTALDHCIKQLKQEMALGHVGSLKQRGRQSLRTSPINDFLVNLPKSAVYSGHTPYSTAASCRN